ncbi:MAG TPA: hypothetical protein VJA26_08235 [Gammaproteobacteria bacterium]|nr:hypothetical protein [Gammaproteobacteria bacterium]
MTTFARRAADGGWWVLAIALLGVYCGLRGYGESERRDAFALFLERRPIAAELTVVEPTDRSPNALARP